jgi:hypothetical protein
VLARRIVGRGQEWKHSPLYQLHAVLVFRTCQARVVSHTQTCARRLRLIAPSLVLLQVADSDPAEQPSQLHLTLKVHGLPCGPFATRLSKIF